MKKTALLRLGALMLTLVCLLALVPSASAAAPEEPKLSGQAAIVIDYETGYVLYAKDPDTMRVPASMTKVMTAYIVYEELAKGTITMDTPVPISDHVATISRDNVNYQTMVPLPRGGTVPVETLLKLVLLPSASASCVALAELISGTEEAFVQRMNETARRLDLDAVYVNTYGYDNNMISPRSQAMLVREFLMEYPEVLEITSQPSVEFDSKTYPSTNWLLPGAKYAYEGVDGFKTGHLRVAGYCQAVTAVRDGRRVISVVMHSSTEDSRASDSVKLLDYGFACLTGAGKYIDAAESWCRPALEKLDSLGVELHTTGGLFRPNDNVTRAEFTAMLCSVLEHKNALPEKVQPEGTPNPFTDIHNHWAHSTVLEAWERGLVNGVGDGLFAPEAPITRQEIMVILDRAIPFPDGNGLYFYDAGSVAFWALPSAARLTAAGIFSGTDGLLNPTSPTTRAEAVQVLARILDRL